MRPPPARRIGASAAWEQRKTPFRLMSITRFHSSSVMLVTGAMGKMPALLISMSSPPNASWQVSTIARTLSDWVTSTWIASPRWPSAWNSVATC